MKKTSLFLMLLLAGVLCFSCGGDNKTSEKEKEEQAPKEENKEETTKEEQAPKEENKEETAKEEETTETNNASEKSEKLSIDGYIKQLQKIDTIACNLNDLAQKGIDENKVEINKKLMLYNMASSRTYDKYNNFLKENRKEIEAHEYFKSGKSYCGLTNEEFNKLYDKLNNIE